MIITLAVNAQHSDWCVYTHHTPMNELLYIGFDRTVNAFKTHHLATNMSWIKAVGESKGDIIITIVNRYPDKTQAMIAAQKMRNSNDPISQRGGKRTAGYVRRVDTNTYYISGAVAAKAHMISSSAMSNHLNGVKGYDKVHGLKFERLLSEPPPGVQIVNKLGQTVNTPTPQVQTPVQSPGVASVELIWSLYNEDLQTEGNKWPDGVTDWESYYHYTVRKLVTEFGWAYKAPEPHQIAPQQAVQVPPVEEDERPPLPWFTGDD